MVRNEAAYVKKISKELCMLLAAAVLFGCAKANDEENTTSDTSTSVQIVIDTDSTEETAEIADYIRTTLPYVQINGICNIEKAEASAGLLEMMNKYGFPEAFNEDYYYFADDLELKASYISSNMEEKTTARLISYNEKSGKATVLLEETPQETKYGTLIYYYPELVYGSFLYYYRYEHCPDYDDPSKGYAVTELYRINLTDNSSEKIFTFQPTEQIPKTPVVCGGMMYFYDFDNVNYESGDYDSTIYRYDISSGKTEMFRDNSEYPVAYKDGIIYYHDEGFFYSGNEKLKALDGKYYENDPLVFYPNPEGLTKVSGVFSDGETVMYSYSNYDEHEKDYAIGSTLGFINEEGERVDIAQTVPEKVFYIIEPDNSDGLYLFRQKPNVIIYDSYNKAFSKLLIEEDDFLLRTDNDTALCICFDYDPGDSNEKTLTRAVIYKLKRH